LRATLDGEFPLRVPEDVEIAEVRCASQSVPLRRQDDGTVVFDAVGGKTYEVIFR
jgi:hypothetical protein